MVWFLFILTRGQHDLVSLELHLSLSLGCVTVWLMLQSGMSNSLGYITVWNTGGLGYFTVWVMLQSGLSYSLG